MTYNQDVNVDLYIRPFNVQQKSLFMGAVEGLSAAGGTATNDAVLVALNELSEYSKSNPDHKLVVFVLSDGETNKGLEYGDVVEIMQWTDIPCLLYTSPSPRDGLLSRMPSSA